MGGSKNQGLFRRPHTKGYNNKPAVCIGGSSCLWQAYYIRMKANAAVASLKPFSLRTARTMALCSVLLGTPVQAGLLAILTSLLRSLLQLLNSNRC